MTQLAWKSLSTPVGELELVTSDATLVGVFFPQHRGAQRPTAIRVAKHALLELASTQLREYFAGERTAFSVPLMAAGTAFQREVWSALGRLSFGERVSYAQLAAAIGRPGAVRAVGAANARNPLSIFVPCHRVIASSGALTGYAGGLPAKQWLLEHEARVLAAEAGARPATFSARERSAKHAACDHGHVPNG